MFDLSIIEEQELAKSILEEIFRLMPGLEERYNNYQIERSLEDINYHLSFLRDSITFDNQQIFNDYVEWTRIVLEVRGVPTIALMKTFEAMINVLKEEFDEESLVIVQKFIEGAFENLKKPLPSEESRIKGLGKESDNAERYLDLILNGEKEKAINFILDLVEKGMPLKEVYLDILQPVQKEIGRLWQYNKISVAKEHYCTAITQMVISQLYKYLFSTKKKGKTLVATCISGELHEMAIRIVADFFEMDGWDTYYLGANTPIPSIIETLKDTNARLLLVSATLLTNVKNIKALIAQIRASDVKDVKIMVGGYPFSLNKGLWKKVGADAYAGTAESAIEVANGLIT